MGWKLTLFIVLSAVAVGYIIHSSLNPPLKAAPPSDIGDEWWGRGLPEVSGSKQDTSVRKFRVNVSDEVLNDLDARLRNTRFVDRVEDAAFRYGFDSDYMKQVQRYWLERYSWRDAEKRLNQFDQFLTNIEGIDVHFVHVKPKLKPGQKAKPIIIVHGWPGSIYEFYKMIPMLTDPLSHGGSAEDIFEVICPSIPGYGFSEAPHKQGFAAYAAAGIFNKLMLRLGFDKYYVQGGDWGSIITLNMAIMYPSNVKGYHANMGAQSNLKSFLYPILGQYLPSIFLPDKRDQERLLPVTDRMLDLLQESGYMHIQATKPQTAGQGVNDSPIGLAAYILEKFSTWTIPQWRDLPDGGLTKSFTLDDLLTNVMIYWVNGNIASSMRLYKEELGGNSRKYHEIYANLVPMGYASFPNELFYNIRAVTKHYNPNLMSFNYMPRGGHFAAFEEPQLLAEDIRQFVRKVEAL
ncbi:epoxide hydrolase 1-like [Lytechinus variegatus]|uniref:epoxide hydrolase 1-like n=1 Tax=Lytechinus variegatus TaxID=7654 RepID=UPI001BB1E31C|nr:epoxide hydrolase 1-like [Lytechinus variegatus]